MTFLIRNRMQCIENKNKRRNVLFHHYQTPHYHFLKKARIAASHQTTSYEVADTLSELSTIYLDYFVTQPRMVIGND